MELSSITREQRMLGAAAACVLFLISLFFPWFDSGFTDETASASDLVPGWWVLLIFAAIAAVLLAADALNLSVPAQVHSTAVPAYLTSVNLIVTLMFFLDPFDTVGRRFGIFLALVFAIIATALAVMAWREDRAR